MDKLEKVPLHYAGSRNEGMVSELSAKCCLLYLASAIDHVVWLLVVVILGPTGNQSLSVETAQPTRCRTLANRLCPVLKGFCPP